MSALILFIGASLLSLPLAAQNTINVPAEQPTIQAGIDAAQEGDTVLVAPGTYPENINFKGKAITVTSGAKSFSDPAVSTTIIIGSGSIPTVSFQANEPSTAVLNGFTVQSPLSTAVYLLGSSATISNNSITKSPNCAVVVIGGTASPLIQGNDISGGAAPTEGTGCVTSNQVYNRFLQGEAGVTAIDAGNVQILGNTFEGLGSLDSNLQDAPSGAGAIFAQNLYATSTSLVAENNIIRNNLSTAGEISAFALQRTTIVQNLLYGNRSGGLGDGAPPGISVTSYLSSNLALTVTNNTSYGNTEFESAQQTPNGEQGDFGYAFNPYSIQNSLFISTNSFGTVNCGTNPGVSLTYTNNDAFYAGAGLPPTCSPSNSTDLSIDPQFMNPATGDFHTQRTSPVVGAGNINAPGLPPTDLDGKNRTVCGSVDMGVYQTHPIPPITLTSSPNPSVGGTSVTISAHVTGNCNIPTGVLTFFDGAGQLGTGTLDSSGNTTFTTASLTAGTHTITATYPGDFNFDASVSAGLTQVVTGYPTITTLVSVAPNPVSAFQSITFSASVASQFGTPNGTISFLASGKAFATADINGSGQAAASVNTFGAGTYNITAVYNPSINYAGSASNPIILIVNGAPTAISLASSLNPSTYGQSVTFTAIVNATQSATIPTGTVSFRDGAATIGTATLNSAGVGTFTSSTLAAGSHPMTTVYSGSANDNASTSATLNQIVATAPTTVSLTGTPNPANSGLTVTLTASVAFGGSSATAGSVLFADQFGTLGSSNVINGQAIFTTSTLAIGTHNITASIAAGGNFTAGTSPVLAEVIEPHDFTITLTPATLSVVTGQKGQTSVQLTSMGSYSGTLNLTASQIPTYASLTITPTSAALAAGGSSRSQLSVNTASLPPGVGSNEAPKQGRRPPLALAVACCVLPFVLRRRRRFPALLILLSALALSVSLSSCSNISYPLNRVAPGTYIIPVTATDPATQTTHTAQLTLVVTD